MKNFINKALLFLWRGLFAASILLFILNFVFLNGKSFDVAYVGASAFKGARSPQTLLIFLLSMAMNVLLLFFYKLKSDGSNFKNILNRSSRKWRQSPQHIALYVVRIKSLVVVTGAYINFLIASMLYMTLQYFYPQLPCPRHLLMILIWFVLTLLVGLYALIQILFVPKDMSLN